ncbi:GNAT family N-acetyltransferase [Pelagicoccus sp. SDUM812003]|uniref:lipid II:glycine glycyltransferase FemX n=1 Tax=Pelagicoccus sp. SDUM812003 TaxID=3041267 RepID=UPI00280E59B9|nr:GNAT family N-acetyltransferase [Pelagicoccus sp. SDUM812003]MDQ8204981.1 GNAT family N-acetyltransferase [Pelagicoccus sp. SDUM812003]
MLETTYGYKTHLVTLKAGDQTIAAIPVSVVRSTLTGSRAISMPFFDLCPPIAKTADLAKSLFNELLSFAEKQKLDYVEARGWSNESTCGTPSLSFYNHTVPLSEGPESIFNRFSSSNRRAIRKAQKEGVDVGISTGIEAVKDFYRLQCITRRRHGLPPQPFTFFKNLHREILSEGKGVVVYARVENQTVSSSIYMEQGDTVHYKYGASDLAYQNARCNNIVMWKALEHFSQKGLRVMDFGRNSPKGQEGLRRYKLGYGAEEKTVHYHRYSLKKQAVVPMSDDIYGWHNVVFANLPAPLGRLAGKLIYKHIA